MLVSNTLPATGTRSDWQFAYRANTDPTALADGSRTEEKGKRVRRTVTTANAVQEQPCWGGRAFPLVKGTCPAN